MNLFQGSDNNDLNKNTAFSIVELLVVVAMIGIITSIAIPQLGGVLPNSKDILAAEFVEKINRSLKKHNQSNYKIRYPQDDSIAGDEMLIVRTLQWRNHKSPTPGSPYLRQDWHPVVSSDESDYRLKWNGSEFVLISPSLKGIGIRLSFDGSDYGKNYQFDEVYEPIGK